LLVEWAASQPQGKLLRERPPSRPEITYSLPACQPNNSSTGQNIISQATHTPSTHPVTRRLEDLAQLAHASFILCHITRLKLNAGALQYKAK
jgi:hypothetical protein